MARPRQVSDEEILNAARHCFLTQGPAASVSKVAKQLGISQAALFKRFGTKKALLLAALEPSGEPDFFVWLGKGPDERPVAVQLRELIGMMAQFFVEMVPCLAALRSSGIDPSEVMCRYEVPPPLMAKRLITQWFERAAQNGLVRTDLDADAAATAMMGAMQVRPFLAHIAGVSISDSAPVAYLDALVTLLVDGVRVREDRE